MMINFSLYVDVDCRCHEVDTAHNVIKVLSNVLLFSSVDQKNFLLAKEKFWNLLELLNLEKKQTDDD